MKYQQSVIKAVKDVDNQSRDNEKKDEEEIQKTTKTKKNQSVSNTVKDANNQRRDNENNR